MEFYLLQFFLSLYSVRSAVSKSNFKQKILLKINLLSILKIFLVNIFSHYSHNVDIQKENHRAINCGKAKAESTALIWV